MTAVADGSRLHYVEAGSGAPVVLLHGFPEFWYSWRRQLPALAAAGFRALALDLPGYNESEPLARLPHYRIASLVQRLAEFIRSVAGGRAFVVGHDWGGVLAFRLAARHPELVARLAVLNAPHPSAYRAALARDPLQWLRSAYVLLFQVHALPEWILRAGDFALLERAWRRDAAPGAFSDADIAAYKHALSKPGRLTAGLNYYRAALRYGRDLYGEPQKIAAPTLVLWGERDPYLGVRLLDSLSAWAPDLCVERIPEASHWVQHDAPARVNAALIEFFRGMP